jgi:ribonuclease HI
MLQDYSLNKFENKRLQRLKMKIDHLNNFEVEWVPGKKNEEADALSQAPIHHATEED